MFYFQSEETVGGTGCTGKVGACGKKEDVAKMQDRLTGKLIGLARMMEEKAYRSEKAEDLIVAGLSSTLTNANFNSETLQSLLDQIEAEMEKASPDCVACKSCWGGNYDYDMDFVWEADKDIRGLKTLILFGIRGVAAYAYHAAVLGRRDARVDHFLQKALMAVGNNIITQEELFSIAMEVGEVNLVCRAMLG